MVIIKKATEKDIESIVNIHQNAFANFFLTSLGESFLRLYYKCMCKSEDALTLCAFKDGVIVGFSTSAYVSHGFNRILIKKNLFAFGLMGVRLLFTKPQSIIRLLKNLDKESSESINLDKGEYAELYSIAVSPDCQGLGVGRLLLTKTEEGVALHNTRLSLTTDYFYNEKTIAFYHYLGYQDYYEFVTYPNRKMWRMIKNLK